MKAVEDKGVLKVIPETEDDREFLRRARQSVKQELESRPGSSLILQDIIEFKEQYGSSLGRYLFRVVKGFETENNQIVLHLSIFD